MAVDMKRKRRGYLKHYNDATVGQTIQKMIHDGRYDAVVLFWFTLELMNQNDGQEVEVDIKYLCRIMKMRTDGMRSLSSYLDQTKMDVSSRIDGSIPELRLILDGSNARLFYSKYSEYQDSRSTNNPRKSHQSAPIKDNRLKIIDNNTNSFFDFDEKGKSNANVTLSVTRQTEWSDFIKHLEKERDELQKKYSDLDMNREIKNVLYNYQNNMNISLPKTKQHWLNAIKKKLVVRQEEVNELKSKGLKEVWIGCGNVEYHRI